MRALVDRIFCHAAVALCVVEAVARLGSCGYGVDVIGGSDDGVAEVVDLASDLWPDIADVASRLDVYVVDDDRVDAAGLCGRAAARDATSCFMWPGSDLARARVYVARGEDIPAAVLHELQHAHLYADEATAACASHLAACGWIDVDTPSGEAS